MNTQLNTRASHLLSESERLRMLRLVQSDLTTPVNLAIALALTTGMRRSEICALRWSAINDSGIIAMPRTASTKTGASCASAPKEPTKHREIYLVPWLNTHLQGIRAEASLRNPYVLRGKAKGTPYNPSTFTHQFKRFCASNGFDCQFRDLRHSFIAALVVQGIDANVLGNYLGRSAANTVIKPLCSDCAHNKRKIYDAINNAFDCEV